MKFDIHRASALMDTVTSVRVKASVLVLLLFSLVASAAQARTFSVAIDPSSAAPNPTFIESNLASKKRFERVKYEEIPPADRNDLWKTLVDDLASRSRTRLRFVSLQSQLDFEIEAASGDFDFVYISPTSFIATQEQNIYRALAKPKSKPLRGIMAVRADSDISSVRDLSGKEVVFPGLLNFGASIAPRDTLQKLKIDVRNKYVNTAKEAYESVLRGSAVAAMGTRHTLESINPRYREQLKIIWDTPGYTPYAFAVHNSVPFFAATKIQKALVSLFKSPDNRQILELLNIDNGFEVAKDSDWQDLETMDLNSLMHGQNAMPE